MAAARRGRVLWLSAEKTDAWVALASFNRATSFPSCSDADSRRPTQADEGIFPDDWNIGLKSFFPDTHFFLHFRSAQDIAWSEVTDHDEVRLVVGRSVAKELDKKKFELRGRPQNRARSIVSNLGSIVSGTGSGVLRDKDPRVVLEVAVERPAGWMPPADLDPTWGDDVLLADVLAFRHGHPDADVALLTGDPGLMAKARAHGVEVVSLLDRGWELPEEKTPEQKEVEKLRREVHDLKQVGPSIVCELLVGDKAHAVLDVEVVQHPPLSDDVAEELLSELKLKHPKVVEPLCPASLGTREPGTQVMDLDEPAGPAAWTAPERAEVEAYSREYDRWVDEAKAFIRDASASFVDAPLDVLVRLELSNKGNAPAEGVQLRVEGQGGFLVSVVKKKPGRTSVKPPRLEAGPARFREPPRPPEWKRKPSSPPRSLAAGSSAHLEALFASQANVPGLSALNASVAGLGATGRLTGMPHLFQDLPDVGIPVALLDFALQTSLDERAMALARPPLLPREHYLLPPPLPEPHDRHGFYRRETPASRQGVGLGFDCDEFRHRLEPRSFEFRLVWDTAKGPPRNGAVWVRLSASNMREPFKTTVPVRVRMIQADVRRMVAALLP